MASKLLASVLIVAGLAYWFWPRTPQLHGNAETFRCVDALYTAIRSEDLAQLQACQDRLDDLRSRGLISDAAYTDLGELIAKSRQGGWRPAAERLYDFMAAQRLDPTIVRRNSAKTNK